MQGKTKRKISVIVGAILLVISIVLVVRFIGDEPADNKKNITGAESVSVKTVTAHLVGTLFSSSPKTGGLRPRNGRYPLMNSKVAPKTAA